MTRIMIITRACLKVASRMVPPDSRASVQVIKRCCSGEAFGNVVGDYSVFTGVMRLALVLVLSPRITNLADCRNEVSTESQIRRASFDYF